MKLILLLLLLLLLINEQLMNEAEYLKKNYVNRGGVGGLWSTSRISDFVILLFIHVISLLSLSSIAIEGE